jgi:hypothetical protein
MHVLRNAIVLAVAWCTTAHAGTKTTIKLDPSGKTWCTHETVAADGDRDIFEVSLLTASRTALEVRITRGQDAAAVEVGKATIAANKKALDAPLVVTAKDDDTVVVGLPAMNCQFVFSSTRKEPEVDSARVDAALTQVDATIAADNQNALAYLEKQQITGHTKSGRPWGHSYRLYHLPDGSPAFPLPRGISEEDHLEPWIVRLASEAATLEISQCGDVPSVRISGARPGTETAQKLKGGAKRAALPPPTFKLVQMSAPFACADAAAYKVTTARGTQEVSLTVTPVYMFSWGLAFGFDFGRPGQISLVDRAGEGGTTEKVIARTEERAGFRPMATLTWNACRANLKAWDLCDVFGLTAMADLEHLTEGGGIGIKLQPYPGLGVLIGMTFFQVDTIRAASGLKIGGVFTEPGELPIHKQFTKGSFGLFLGVGGDTATVKSLF